MLKLKDIYDKLPISLQNVAVSLYGWKRERDRYGGSFKERLAYFSSIEKKDTAFIEEYQLSELKKLIAVSKNSEYYKCLFEQLKIDINDFKDIKDIKKIPILEKDSLRGHESSFYTDNRRDNLTFHTSGSTGTPLTVKMSKADFRDRMAILERLRLCHGVNRKMRYITFVGKIINNRNKKCFWRYNIFGHQLVMSVYDLHQDNKLHYINKIKSYKPDVIEGYPSALSVIAQWIVEENISLSVKAVFVTAETLTAEQKEIMEKAFKCRIINYYGSTEGAPMITQCEHGNLHISYETGIIEFLREDGTDADPGELANMVVTSFSSKVTPLIRYKIDDLAIYSLKKCACGRNTLVVEEIVGRVDDVLETPYKGKVARLSTSLKLLPSEIKRAQIQQHSPVKFVLIMETEEKLSTEKIQPVLDDLHNKLGPVDIEVSYTNKIPGGANGKFRSQVNCIKKNIVHNKLISVVMPVYNVQDCLESSVYSVLNQTLKNLEVILVNDGSTDNSGQICAKIASKDERVKVINQPNRGVSAARNTGLEAATGDYIVFIDSDDKIHPDTLELLYNNLVENNADISFCGVKIEALDGSTELIYGTGRKYIFTREEAIANFLKGGLFPASCNNKLYKADLAKSVRFEEGKKINEDRYYFYSAVLKADKIVFEDKCKYFYIKRKNSASTYPFREASFDQVYFSKKIMEEVSLEYPSLRLLAEYNDYKTKLDVLRNLYRNKEAEKKFCSEAKSLREDIKAMPLKKYSDYFPFMKKTEIFLLKHCFFAYKKFLSLYNYLFK